MKLRTIAAALLLPTIAVQAQTSYALTSGDAVQLEWCQLPGW